MAKCPHCKNTLSSVRLSNPEVKGTARSYKGVAYSCPSCDAVLSVGIDPLAIKTDAVKELFKAVDERIHKLHVALQYEMRQR